MATHTAHRRAFGPKRQRTDTQKATHVAESILDHEARGAAWSWQQSYGIDPASPYGHLAQTILTARRALEAQEERLMTTPCTTATP